MSVLKAITIAAAVWTIERLQLHGKQGKIHACWGEVFHLYLTQNNVFRKYHVSACAPTHMKRNQQYYIINHIGMDQFLQKIKN